MRNLLKIGLVFLAVSISGLAAADSGATPSYCLETYHNLHFNGAIYPNWGSPGTYPITCTYGPNYAVRYNTPLATIFPTSGTSWRRNTIGWYCGGSNQKLCPYYMTSAAKITGYFVVKSVSSLPITDTVTYEPCVMLNIDSSCTAFGAEEQAHLVGPNKYGYYVAKTVPLSVPNDQDAIKFIGITDTSTGESAPTALMGISNIINLQNNVVVLNEYLSGGGISYQGGGFIK